MTAPVRSNVVQYFKKPEKQELKKIAPHKLEWTQENEFKPKSLTSYDGSTIQAQCMLFESHIVHKKEIVKSTIAGLGVEVNKQFGDTKKALDTHVAAMNTLMQS